MRPSSAPKIIFTVTNDISYDQRMARICTSLALNGYDVTLIGFERAASIPLEEKPYKQIRIQGIPEQGKLLYATYWRKLYSLLMKLEADAICAIDLDTMLPVYWATKKKKCKRIYDAHEIFTELKEVVSKKSSYIIWNRIAQRLIPKFPNGYTIGKYYSKYFKEHYGVNYEIVRNATIYDANKQLPPKEPFILYQGAVNHGRSFEQLIPAMADVDAQLIICGKGNYYEQARALAKKLQLDHKITFTGYLQPQELKKYTQRASVGITLFEADNVLSNYYSMANRFFDYMHNGVVQVCNKYPEYIDVNKQYEVALLLDDTQPSTIAKALNAIINNNDLRERLMKNSLEASKVYCWQEEEKRLLQFYERLFQ